MQRQRELDEKRRLLEEEAFEKQQERKYVLAYR
jgi:hypothetical protein